MTASRARRVLGICLAGIAVALLAAGGVTLIVWGQKTAERLAYETATAGPPCPAVAEPPAYVHPADLKTGAFEGARFAYIRGDMDCQTAPVGDLAGDDGAYCAFDRPGYLSVATGAATTDYLIVIGQAVVTNRGGGRWRCAVRPPP